MNLSASEERVAFSRSQLLTVNSLRSSSLNQILLKLFVLMRVLSVSLYAGYVLIFLFSFFARSHLQQLWPLLFTDVLVPITFLWGLGGPAEKHTASIPTVVLICGIGLVSLCSNVLSFPTLLFLLQFSNQGVSALSSYLSVVSRQDFVTNELGQAGFGHRPLQFFYIKIKWI